MNWDAIVLAAIAGVPGTIIALGSYRSSVRNKRELGQQSRKVRDVETVAHTAANKVDKLHGETMRFMSSVGIRTADFEAAKLKQKPPGFDEGAP
jgi:hypothetical protein